MKSVFFKLSEMVSLVRKKGTPKTAQRWNLEAQNYLFDGFMIEKMWGKVIFLRFLKTFCGAIAITRWHKTVPCFWTTFCQRKNELPFGWAENAAPFRENFYMKKPSFSWKKQSLSKKMKISCFNIFSFVYKIKNTRNRCVPNFI